MTQITNVWRVIAPQARKSTYEPISTNTYSANTTDEGSVAAISWYANVMSGPASRIQFYKQFDNMDQDVDMSRALDIVAEEMSNPDNKTQLPFLIEYFKEDNEDVSNTTAVTLRQALRQWSALQKFEQRMFQIARMLIKYGDCFLYKTSDTKPWRFIHPSDVLGIGIDDDDMPVSYHVRLPANKKKQNDLHNTEEVTVIPARGIIHFKLNDDCQSGPFGYSLLRPIFRTYRQLSMIEDAVIIYRIVRAPERRVFYIDTGNLPPQRVKAYLEQVKNELRQKRTPGVNGTRDEIDGAYNPQSLQEDIFLSQNGSGRGSRVETLPGGTEDFGTNLLKYFQEKIFRGLRIPTSYLGGTEGQGAQYNDGKVGIAYIEELRFANFIRRLQQTINPVLDNEFKTYVRVTGLIIDDEIYKIRLLDPANFALYRQAALDSDLISSFNNIEANKYLARRFILKRYLGLTDDELQMNEVMLQEERGIESTDTYSTLRQIYDPAIYENRDNITIDTEKTASLDDGDTDTELDMPGEEEDSGGMFGSTPDSAEPSEPEVETPAEEPEEPAPEEPAT